MEPILIPACALEIRPVAAGELDSIFEVYRQCEDFLALGPVATASMDMVLADRKLSQDMGGVFCGIYQPDGKMLGVLDVVLAGYHGDPSAAYLSLLMIAAPYRNQSLGRAVVEAFEGRLRENLTVTTLLAGVQVNNPLAIKFWQRMGFRITSGPKLMPDQTTVYDLRKELI